MVTQSRHFTIAFPRLFQLRFVASPPVPVHSGILTHRQSHRFFPIFKGKAGLLGKLKQEWLNGQRFRTKEEARAAVFVYIWIFYNRKRIHKANGYLTPEEYYRQHQTDSKAA